MLHLGEQITVALGIMREFPCSFIQKNEVGYILEYSGCKLLEWLCGLNLDLNASNLVTSVDGLSFRLGKISTPWVIIHFDNTSMYLCKKFTRLLWEIRMS